MPIKVITILIPENISICSVYNIHAAPYIPAITKLWCLHIGKILTLSLVKGILYFTLWYNPFNDAMSSV